MMSWLKNMFSRKRKLYSFNPEYNARPSDTILEAMKFARITETGLWLKTSLEIMTVDKLLVDKIKIDYYIARELSKILGSEPEFWIALSKNYFDRQGKSETNANN
jgi:plasmid maintenance system antidote protein VapI